MTHASLLKLNRRALLAAGGASLVLSGCASMIGPGPSPQLYVLRPKLGPLPEAPTVAWQLAVAMPVAPQSLDTARIALQLTSETMDYYANAAWQDRVPVIVQRVVIEAFERSGKLPGVARDTEGVRADYLLQTDIRKFEARYNAPDSAPTVIVAISAKMVRVPGRVIAAASEVRGTAVASTNTVPAVVEAFDVALGDAVEQIVSMALAVPAPQAADHGRKHRRG